MNFLLLNFLLDHPPLTVETAFDLVVFIFFFFSSQEVAITSCTEEPAIPVLSSHYTDTEALL